MKKLEARKALQALSVAELQERLVATEATYAKRAIDHAVSPIENSASLRQQRREIAQIKTILRERELANN